MELGFDYQFLPPNSRPQLLCQTLNKKNDVSLTKGLEKNSNGGGSTFPTLNPYVNEGAIMRVPKEVFFTIFPSFWVSLNPLKSETLLSGERDIQGLLPSLSCTWLSLLHRESTLRPSVSVGNNPGCPREDLTCGWPIGVVYMDWSGQKLENKISRLSPKRLECCVDEKSWQGKVIPTQKAFEQGCIIQWAKWSFQSWWKQLVEVGDG